MDNIQKRQKSHQKLYEWSNVRIFSRGCKADTPVDVRAVMAGGGARTSAGKKQSGSICCCSSLTISECQGDGPRRLGIPATRPALSATANLPSAAGTAVLTEHHSTDFILRLSQRPAQVQDVVSVTGHLILRVLICSSATAGNMPKFPGALI